MVHIGIIPDGNRRWSIKHDYKIDGLVDNWTKIIIENAHKLINNKFKYLKELNEVSFYVCSIDNIQREDNTGFLIYSLIRSIYKMYKSGSILPDKKENDEYSKLANLTRINYVGEIDLLPPDIQDILAELKTSCGNNPDKKYTLNLAIAYDYKKDIINVSTRNLKNYTRKQSDIDIVFRSGGEYRTSGFFPTKILYSELFFSKKFWPEIRLSDINKVIKKFHARNRRFGK